MVGVQLAAVFRRIAQLLDRPGAPDSRQRLAVGGEVRVFVLQPDVAQQHLAAQGAGGGHCQVQPQIGLPAGKAESLPRSRKAAVLEAARLDADSQSLKLGRLGVEVVMQPAQPGQGLGIGAPKRRQGPLQALLRQQAVVQQQAGHGLVVVVPAQQRRPVDGGAAIAFYPCQILQAQRLELLEPTLGADAVVLPVQIKSGVLPIQDDLVIAARWQGDLLAALKAFDPKLINRHAPRHGAEHKGPGDAALVAQPHLQRIPPALDAGDGVILALVGKDQPVEKPG